MKTTILAAIATMDNAAAIPAYRALSNSAMARSIGAIRQHLRDQARGERDETSDVPGLDQRNGADENTRAQGEIARAMGFEERQNPLALASAYHAVYDLALAELQTLSVSKWDKPMNIEAMLDFMITKAQPIDEATVLALAKAVKVDPTHIRKMHEIQDRQDRDRLADQRDAIIQTFNGFGENGHEDSLDQLTTVDQHQLAIKLITSMLRAKDQILIRALRTRRLTELGSLALIDDGIHKLADVVTGIEDVHGDEISQALDNGANLRTLDDVTLPA